MSDDDYYYYSDEDAYSMGDSTEGKAEPKEPTTAGSSSSSQQALSSSSSLSSSSDVNQVRKSFGGPSNLEYTILTVTDLQAEQDKLVREVTDVLSTSYDVSYVLLLFFKWNKEKLFEKYYANPEKTCEEAGVVMSPTDGDAAGGGAAMDQDSDFMCNILFIDVPFKETYAMPCGHRFSLAAWQGYLCSKIEEGQGCIFGKCPMEKCKGVVSPQVWEKVLTTTTEDDTPKEVESRKATLERYKRFLAASFVDINKNTRWCPGQNCGCAVQASGAVSEVRCNCGNLFCFKCGLEAHAPIACKELAQWNEKCSNESETANYILSHTKSCTGCGTRIEKNQGCNHMQCKICKYDFCWICMGPWADHGTSTGGYYNCNKFKGGEEDDKVSNAKRELDRYLHYYKRYAAHMQAGKFASEQREKAQRKMEELQTTNCVGWIDVQFLEQAVEQLIDCRRVLKYTYAFAFYLPKGPKKDLFEYNQSMLESHTEKLSELSELALEVMDRSEVINYTRVTGKFLKSLLEQVETEGVGFESADQDVKMTDVAEASVAKKTNKGRRKK